MADTALAYRLTPHSPNVCQALLPSALGPEKASLCVFEPTDCYTIRHTTLAPSSLADPPLVGMLIRQRALNPPPSKLCLHPTPEEAMMLRQLKKRYAYPTKSEVRGVCMQHAHTPVYACHAWSPPLWQVRSIRAALSFAHQAENNSAVQVTPHLPIG